MFPYREACCYHLTPLGWFRGDRQLRYGLLYRRPAPKDQVLSILCLKTIAGNGLMCSVSKEVWRSLDHAQVIGLMARFGSLPSMF
jgi:hypothetical protein